MLRFDADGLITRLDEHADSTVFASLSSERPAPGQANGACEAG